MDTQAKIRETLEKIVELEKVQLHYNTIQAKLDKAFKKLDQLNDVLVKEYGDVKKLEGLSVKALFHKVLGSKEQQIEKERQEYLQASLKYNEYKQHVELLEYERDLFEKKMIDIDTFKSKLQILKKKRESELMTMNSEQAHRLINVVAQLDREIQFNKELAEALERGKQAQQILVQIVDQLAKARQWGQWDMMGSSNRSVEYQKRSSIDRARKLSYNAQNALVHFQEELYDIGEKKYQFDVDIVNFNSFMDVFFDNLISDWVIQQKIRNAIGSISSTHDTVKRILQSISYKMKQCEEQIIKYNNEKDRIILGQ